MADPQNKEKIELEFTFDSKKLEESYKKVLNTSSKFYQDLLKDDDAYRSEIKINLKKELAAHTWNHTQIMKMQKKQTAAGAGPLGGATTAAGASGSGSKRTTLTVSKVMMLAQNVNIRSATKGKQNVPAGAGGGAPAVPTPPQKPQTAAARLGKFLSNVSQSTSASGKAITKSPLMKSGGDGLDKVATLTDGLGSVISKVGMDFGEISGLLEEFAGGLTGVIGGLLAFYTITDKMQKDMNKKLVSGTGMTGVGSIGGLEDLRKFSLSMQFAENSTNAFGKGLRLSNDEVQALGSGLMKSGVTLKGLGGDMYAFQEAQYKAAATAKVFGVSIEESTKMFGDFYTRTGYGVEKINKGFTILYQEVQKSGMTANSFLATIQSVTSHFSIFLDQTITFSKILSKMASSGMSQKLAAGVTEAMGVFGNQDRMTGITQFGLNPEDNKKMYQERLKEIQSRKDEIYDADQRRAKGQPLKPGQTGGSNVELTNLVISEALLKGDIKGGNLGGAHRSLIPAEKLMLTYMKKIMKGTKGSQEDLTDLLQNEERMQTAAAEGQIDPGTLEKMILGVKTAMQEQGAASLKDYKETKEGFEQISNALDDQEDVKDAAKLAKETTTVLSGTADMGNTILLQIKEVLDGILNWVGAIAKIFVSEAKNALPKGAQDFIDKAEKTVQDNISAAHDQLIAQSKELRERFKEQSKDLTDPKGGAAVLGSFGAKGLTEATGTASKDDAVAATARAAKEAAKPTSPVGKAAAAIGDFASGVKEFGEATTTIFGAAKKMEDAVNKQWDLAIEKARQEGKSPEVLDRMMKARAADEQKPIDDRGESATHALAALFDPSTLGKIMMEKAGGIGAGKLMFGSKNLGSDDMIDPNNPPPQFNPNPLIQNPPKQPGTSPAPAQQGPVNLPEKVTVNLHINPNTSGLDSYIDGRDFKKLMTG